MVRECTARDSVELSRLIQMFGNSNTPKETQFLDISAYIENAITRKLITILGLEAEDTLIGYASIVVYQSLTDREANAYLDELFIHPDFQNKGYGWVRPKKDVKMAFFALRNVLSLRSVIQWRGNEGTDSRKHEQGTDDRGKNTAMQFDV